MSVEQNKANERRLYDEVWNKGNLSLIPELVSPDFVHGNSKGHQGYKEMVIMMRNAFPDYHSTIEDMVGEGDNLVYRFTATGTFNGKLANYEPTGKKAKWTQAIFTNYKNGKVAWALNFMDGVNFGRELGVTIQ
jgi:predicted ester cyclase